MCVYTSTLRLTPYRVLCGAFFSQHLLVEKSFAICLYGLYGLYVCIVHMCIHTYLAKCINTWVLTLECVTCHFLITQQIFFPPPSIFSALTCPTAARVCINVCKITKTTKQKKKCIFIFFLEIADKTKSRTDVAALICTYVACTGNHFASSEEDFV